ncbi:MAG: hypothetical protein IIC74_08820 [Bacteroidetes bacterium]|nr:hypothetical protein [Bacteroidota bacterium]
MIKHLILFMLIFGLIACNKDDDFSPVKIGNATALKNGVGWSANVYYFTENSPSNLGFSMGMEVYNNEGLRRENISFIRFKNHFNPQTIYPTNYQIENDSIRIFYSTILDDGDVVGDIYDIDTTATNNFIQITSYNSSRAEIKGIFNVSLILTRDSNEPGTPPQNLVFTNGEFTVKVQREWFE